MIIWHHMNHLHTAHHFILLRLSLFDIRVDRVEWWFEHSVSWLRVYFSTEGPKNIFWLWLSPFRGWDSLVMAFTGEFVYVAHHFMLLRLSSFDLKVDSEGWSFEHSVLRLSICLLVDGAKSVSWTWLSLLPRWGRSDYSIY